MNALLSRLNAATLTSPEAVRRAVWGLVLALVALLGYTSSGTAGWVLGQYLESRFPSPAAAAVRPETTGVRQRKPISAFDPILGNNIFRARRSLTPNASAPVASSASAAPLRLTLSGVFIAGSGSFAFIVGPDGRSEQVYRAGDCVPRLGDDESADCQSGQGKLTRVQADRIVVTFGGQPTVFMLEKNAESIPEEAPRAPVRPLAPAAPGAPLPSTRTGNTIETHIPNAEVEKAFENFADLVKQARVVPFSQDGVTTGFQIQAIVPGSVFQRLGLQNQDVIKAVNGQSLTTADQALRLFTVFRNEKEVVLDVQRKNEELKLSYIIQ